MAARRTRRKKKIQERDLRGWRWLVRFQRLLDAARARVPPGPREEHGLRRLHAEEYLSLFLLGLFNPVVDSMRGLCEASHLRRVREQTGAEGPVALSRFSEAQHVFEPELLRQVMRALVEEGGAQLGAGRGGVDARALRIVDRTLWKVVPRMKWAEYGGGRGGKTQAVRLHLKLRVSDGAPAAGLISCGKSAKGRTCLRHGSASTRRWPPNSSPGRSTWATATTAATTACSRRWKARAAAFWCGCAAAPR